MGTLTRPYTFTAGTFAVAQQVNVDFDAVYNWINGGAGMWADGSTAFSGIPLLPNTDPSNLNHAVRKRYVDNMFFSGPPWAGPQPTAPIRFQLQSGGYTGVTNAQGQVIITLPNPYSTTIFSAFAIAENSNNSNQGAYCQVFNPTLTSFGINVMAWIAGTGQIVTAVNATVKLLWMTLGY